MYKKEHLEFVNKILKTGATPDEKNRIHELYKIYVDPNHLYWSDSSCASCTGSILSIWNKLRDYVTSNSQKFTK